MGGVEQDGGERGGHDTSVLQTNTAAAASSQSVGWSSFTLHAASCFCRGLRFGGFLKRRQPTYQVVYTRFQVSYVTLVRATLS